MDDKITVYVDGACSGNGTENAKCGWAVKLMYKGHSKIKSGNFRGGTNNIAEMAAFFKALQSIKDKSLPVEVFSDSKYVVCTVNGEFKIGTNVQSWHLIMDEVRQFENLKVTWVKGHNGNIHNEEVDKRASWEAIHAD